MADTREQLSYVVDGMSCGHCKAAVTEEVAALSGVSDIEVDLDTKVVLVAGEQLDDAAIRSAIDRAGYEVRA